MQIILNRASDSVRTELVFPQCTSEQTCPAPLFLQLDGDSSNIFIDLVLREKATVIPAEQKSVDKQHGRSKGRSSLYFCV